MSVTIDSVRAEIAYRHERVRRDVDASRGTGRPKARRDEQQPTRPPAPVLRPLPCTGGPAC